MASTLAASPHLASLGGSTLVLDLNIANYAVGLGLALFLGGLLLIQFKVSRTAKLAEWPLINPAESFEVVDRKRRQHFVRNSAALMGRGEAENAGEPFRLMTDAGELVVLPPSMADEVRNNPNLSFTSATAQDFHAHIPGFEPFASNTSADELTQNVSRKQLTKQLNKVTKPLSDEATFAIKKRFGTSAEWREFAPNPEILDIVARVSSRVFLGDEVCRNPDWIEITKSYTVNSFLAAESLRQFPPWLRNIVHWFHPQCRLIRAQLARARDIIRPVIEDRQRIRKNSAAAAGSGDAKVGHEFNDAIEWYEQESRGRPYDPTVTQLLLSMAAIHTTTDLVVAALLRLAERPKLVKDLRREITAALGSDGWTKTALFNMKLLDSVLKETLRLKPINMVSMKRNAMADVQLSNGQVIPKGTRIVVSTSGRLSPEEYHDPLSFDGARFLAWRSGPKDNASHLVATGATHLGFGHGRHACPGRFFAANESKVLMCHLLLKYDWAIAPGAPTESVSSGFRLASNPAARVMVKRRLRVELDVDKVE